MDFIWILFAFVCGYTLRLIEMPPLIGYLFAGFFLNFIGIEPIDSLDSLADLGIHFDAFHYRPKAKYKGPIKARGLGKQPVTYGAMDTISRLNIIITVDHVCAILYRTGPLNQPHSSALHSVSAAPYALLNS